MEPKVKTTQLIHFDVDGLFKIDFEKDTFQKRISVDVYVPQKNILPVIMVGQVRILNTEHIPVFIATMHTKVALYFTKGENPINDLAEMIKAVNKQETEVVVKAMQSYGVSLNQNLLTVDPSVILNKAIELRDIAIQSNLL